MFVCPKCHGELIKMQDYCVCTICNKHYDLEDDIPIFLHGIHSTQTRLLYKRVNTIFNSCKFSRLIRFMNMGYVSDEKENNNIPFIRNQMVNRNSFYLLYNLFGDFSFNRKVVVDFGCGRGGTLFYLKHLYDEVKLYGVDIDITGLKNISSNCSVAVVDCSRDLPFRNSSIDVAIFLEVFHAIKKKRKLLENVTQILKVGGYIFLADMLDVKQWVKLRTFFMTNRLCIEREDDVTRNVICSCQEISANRIKVLGNKEIGTMAAPGSRTFNLLCERKRIYKFLVVKKC